MNAVRAFIRKSITITATIRAASISALVTFCSHFSINHDWRNISSLSSIPFGRVFCISSIFARSAFVSSMVFAFGTFDTRMITHSFPSTRASPRLWLFFPTSMLAISLRIFPFGREIDPIFSSVFCTGLSLIGYSDFLSIAIPAHPGFVISESDFVISSIVKCFCASFAGSREMVY